MKDNGKIGWYIMAAAVVITFVLFSSIPGNAIYSAPVPNKIFGFMFVALSVPFGLSMRYNWISFSKTNDGKNTLFHLVCIAATVILGLCILIVWHK